MLVVDGVDEDVLPDKHTPNILMSEKSNLDGINGNEREYVIKVRVGDKLVYQNPSLTEAIASLISLYFVFNLQYPPECDNLLNLIQRYFLVFGDLEGCRNRKGQVKGAFLRFQVFKESRWILYSFYLHEGVCWSFPVETG